MKEEKQKCCNEFCKNPELRVTFGPDPYNSEINGDETPVWECEECRYQSTQDI